MLQSLQWSCCSVAFALSALALAAYESTEMEMYIGRGAVGVKRLALGERVGRAVTISNRNVVWARFEQDEDTKASWRPHGQDVATALTSTWCTQCTRRGDRTQSRHSPSSTVDIHSTTQHSLRHHQRPKTPPSTPPSSPITVLTSMVRHLTVIFTRVKIRCFGSFRWLDWHVVDLGDMLLAFSTVCWPWLRFLMTFSTSVDLRWHYQPLIDLFLTLLTIVDLELLTCLTFRTSLIDECWPWLKWCWHPRYLVTLIEMYYDVLAISWPWLTFPTLIDMSLRFSISFDLDSRHY